MLMDKICESKIRSARQSIGMIGTRQGAGVTYTAFLLAFYFGEELGRKTAFLECNSSHDMERIQSSYDWSREDESTFSFHQITCYKEVTPKQLSEIYRMSYETYILDFGAELASRKEAFLSCGIKIVVGDRAQWHQQRLIDFVRMNVTVQQGETWLYLVPCADPHTIKDLRGKLDYPVYSVPFEKEPTMLSKSSLRLFEKLL
jgi:hypothetical protein